MTLPSAPPSRVLPDSSSPPATRESGWRRSRLTPSLAEVYRTVPVRGLTWWRKVLAFAGPGYLVAVGYMDPGNWATDLAGGSQFGYSLLSVILISNLMAVVLQGLACKLGIVTGRDLAQACRDHYSRPVAFGLWVLCEIAIAACDLAEVIGTAIALNLLFHIPLAWGVFMTALDVLLILYLQNKGFRLLEALVITLVMVVGLCFLFEIVVSKPDGAGVARGFMPSIDIVRDPAMLYLAIGILGATVMPHNLYLHSSIVQTRRYDESAEGKREAVRFAFLDSTIALSIALFINAAILIDDARRRVPGPHARAPAAASGCSPRRGRRVRCRRRRPDDLRLQRRRSRVADRLRRTVPRSRRSPPRSELPLPSGHRRRRRSPASSQRSAGRQDDSGLVDDPGGWSVDRSVDPSRGDRDSVQRAIADGAPPTDIAVLARVNASLAPIQVALASSKVPIAGGVGLEFAERTAVRAVLAWLRLAAGRTAQDSLRTTS